MQLKNILKLSAIVLVGSPLLSYAVDITIVNNTDQYGTGRFSFPCSSVAQSKGIIQPHQQNFTVPGTILNVYCHPTCQAHIYLSEDCKGTELATVDINKDTGVTNIDNHQASEYHISPTVGTSFTIDPVKQAWKSWFKWLN